MSDPSTPRERALSAAGILLRDLIGLAGAASIAYGAWLAYEPAGFIVGGVLVLGGIWLASRPEAEPKPPAADGEIS